MKGAATVALTSSWQWVRNDLRSASRGLFREKKVSDVAQFSKKRTLDAENAQGGVETRARRVVVGARERAAGGRE